MPRKKVLKNGLTIITIPKKDSTTATVLVIVGVGSEYEDKKISGISHFLEHMCFKGTKKRPKPIDIANDLDAIGAESNAVTSYQYTGYYAKVNPSHLPRAIDIVSDIYLNQIFDPKEIEKEAGVIVEEINMYEDLPQSKVYYNFKRLLYGDQPAGRDIIGTKKTVRGITKEKLENYRKKHYVASATAVVVAGAFDEKKTTKNIERKFSGIRKTDKEKKAKVKEKQSKPNISLEYKKTDQSHLVVGVRAFSANDKKVPQLRVLSTILGGGMSSRLFQKIREELGAAYYVKSYTNLCSDYGYLAIQVGADNSRVEKVVAVIMDELRKIKKSRVSEKELQKAKDYYIGRMSLGFETTDEQAFYYGEEYIVKNKQANFKEDIAKIKKVTSAQIQNLAKELFVNKGLNMTTIGPIKSKSKFVSKLRI